MNAVAIVRLRAAAATRLSWRSLLISAGSGLAFLLVWQLFVGLVYSANATIPTPLQILDQIFHVDGLAFYVEAAGYTVSAALRGWLWGNGVAIFLGLIVVAIPALERPVMQFGVVTYCLPIVAIGPIMMVVLSGDHPKVVLAALSVFFTTLIGTVVGLRNVDRPMLDLVHVFGGNPRDALFKVRLKAALPSLFAALRIAAPAAVLGAIVGEYMGGTETGLGLMLINSQQAMEIARTWSIAVIATVLAGVGYGITSLIARLATPWAGDVTVDLGVGQLSSVAGMRGWLALLFSVLWSAAIILAAWWGLLRVLDVPPFIGKGPLEVWAYLTDPFSGADNCAALFAESLVTLRDGVLGLSAGMVAAIVVSIVFNLWPSLQRAFMGIAIALRSVPLVAMAPLVVLVFGRNLSAILVIGGVITFFPTLVNVTLALAATPNSARDLMTVFGASRADMLFKVQVPNALPALFASLRMAAPLAMTGAMMAAWLATGKGLGYGILTAGTASDYEGLWTRVALATAFSILLYGLVGVVERIVLAAYSASGSSRRRQSDAH